MSENQTHIRGGATLWARQTIESEVFTKKPAMWFKIWFYLVNRVSHKDTKFNKRGEAFLNYSRICEDVGCTKDQLKKCVSWLKTSTMVSTRKSTRGVWLEITKYDHFQRLDNYYAESKPLTDAPQKHHESTREAPLYSKNGNKQKKLANKLNRVEENSIVDKDLFVTEFFKRKENGWRGVYGKDLVCIARGQVRLKIHDGNFVDFNDSLTKVKWIK